MARSSGPGEAALLAADLRELVAGGARVAIVHGGGPQATELQKRLGLPTTQVAGRRVTDAATLDVMKMVLAGKLNVDLCAILTAAGISAVGLHGASAQVVRATRRPPKVYAGAGPEPVDMGFVGDVTGFNLELLETLWAAGYVPVIACLGADAEGGVYNINADMVGNQLAAALRAERLFLITSAPGRAPRPQRPDLAAAEAHVRRGAPGDRRRHRHRRHDPQARGGDGRRRPGRGRDPHPRQARRRVTWCARSASPARSARRSCRSVAAPAYVSGAPVAAAAAACVMPGASSMMRKPWPVGSNTPSSVITIETTRVAVSG